MKYEKREMALHCTEAEVANNIEKRDHRNTTNSKSTIEEQTINQVLLNKSLEDELHAKLEQ